MEQTQTLIQVISLVAALYGLTWGFIGGPMKAIGAASVRFSLANLLVMAGVLLTLLRQTQETYLAYQVADIVLIVGFTLFRSGVQQLTGARFTWMEHIAVVVIFGAADIWVGPARDTVVAEAFVFSMGVAWITARAARDTYRVMGRSFNAHVSLFLSLPFAICTLVSLMRCVILIAVPSIADSVANIYSQNASAFLWSQLALLLMVNVTMGAIAIGDMFVKLRDQAERDALTGVWNRRAIDIRMETELERFRRTGAPCALAVLDLDHFKSVNDRLGHDGGDAALKHVCSVVQSSLRKMDSLGRFGGEEFLIILPNTDLSSAGISTNRIRTALDARVMIWNDKPVPLTASIGLASMSKSDTPQTLLKRADEALYRAKANGRNRVEIQTDSVSSTG